MFLKSNASHFRRMLDELRRDPSLLVYAQDLMRDNRGILGTLATQTVLPNAHIVGLTHEDNSFCRIRNRIYRRAVELLDPAPHVNCCLPQLQPPGQRPDRRPFQGRLRTVW